MEYRNHIKIIDSHSIKSCGKIYEDRFNEYWENDEYIVIDKVTLGDVEIGRNIIDTLNTEDICSKDKFTDEFIDEMETYIEENVVNHVSFEILESLLEYISKNICFNEEYITVKYSPSVCYGYKNHFQITDYDDYIYGDDFNGYWGNDWYTVIDKKLLGEELALQISGSLDDNESMSLKGNKIDFTDEFREDMLVYVEENVTYKLRNEICEYVLEYLGNNL